MMPTTAFPLDPRIQESLRAHHGSLMKRGELMTEERLSECYALFRERFGPDRLLRLDGERLLNTMHAHGNQDSLVYWLEFKNDAEFPTRHFGSISGGSALKFGLYKSKESGEWKAGHPSNQNSLSLADAITIARKHRDQLLAAVAVMNDLPTGADDRAYQSLQSELDGVARDVCRLAWGHKYMSLLFPDRLDDFHADYFQRYNLCKLLQLPPTGSGLYVCAGRFVSLAGQMGWPITHLTTTLSERNGTPSRYWRIGTKLGEGTDALDVWPDMLAGGYVAIGWQEIGDLSADLAGESLKEAVADKLTKAYPAYVANVASRKAGEIKNFVKDIGENDVVLAADGERILGIGIVRGPYRFEATKPDAAPHRRQVMWHRTPEWKLPVTEGLRTTVWKMGKELQNIVAIERQLLEPPPPVSPAPNTDGPEEMGARWLSLLRRYQHDGTVFHSVPREAQYAVASVSENRATIGRLSADEPVEVTLSAFTSACERLRASNGRMPYSAAYSSTSAIRATILQSPDMALSADRQDIILVEDDDVAADLMVEYIASLRVDQQNSSPKLYQPALIAAVIDSIEAGELQSNQIGFTPLLPRFTEILGQQNVEGGSQQAAYAFKHLANSLFWLLSYHDPQQVADPGQSLTPNQITGLIRHASLKEPFWKALQDPDLRSRIREALESRWFRARDEEAVAFFGSCADFLHAYPRRSGPFSGAAPEVRKIRELVQALQKITDRLVNSEFWKADGSCGQGRFAETPWLAVFDTRNTTQAISGVYPVIHFLFSDTDGVLGGISGIRMGLGVSVTENTRQDLQARVVRLAEELGPLLPAQSTFWSPSSGTNRPTREPSRRGSLGHSYFEGMVLESFFSVADLSSNSAEAIETLGLLLGVYKMWVERPASNGESNDEESYTEEEALADLFLGQEELRTAMALLKRKKNIVLQGAPGVGKTFIAKRLAYLLNGTTAATRIETVQFHQSYSYEDFIQGYRPRSDGGFERRDGVFHRFCEKAKLDDRPHVLIVDEINRGNLSKILGELMMLIEPDKRGPSSALRLLYSQGADESFFVPENVYIIGTMNTADRSLALVDYALRRRFVFVDIRPAFGTARFKEHIIKGGLSEDIAQLIIARMVQLNKEIAEDTSNLGPGYEIGHSYFCSARPTEESEQEWFRRIVRFEIEPLLREYWFDAPDKVTSAVSELLA